MKTLLDDFKTDDEFKNLLPIKQDDLDNISKSIKDNGYEESFPIIVWGEDNIIIDGHTRYEAMKNIKFGGVIPCVRKFFETREEVIAFMVRCQTNRRNLTKEEFIDFVKRCEPYMVEQGGDRGNQYTGGKSAKRSNDHLANNESKLTLDDMVQSTGKSKSTVQRAVKQVREEKAEPQNWEDEPKPVVEEKVTEKPQKQVKTKEEKALRLMIKKQTTAFTSWLDTTRTNVKVLLSRPLDKYESDDKVKFVNEINELIKDLEKAKEKLK